MILSYLLGLCGGIGWLRLKNRRKRYSSLFMLLLVILSIFFIAWASTYAKWPLSFPFWVGWPPGYVSIPETVLISINLFDKPLIMMGYGTPLGPPYSSVMPIIFLNMFIIDAMAGFLGLATVLIPYTYGMYRKRKRKALTF